MYMRRKLLSESTGNYRNGGRLRRLLGLNCAVVAWNQWNLCFFALRLHLRYPGSQVREAYAKCKYKLKKMKNFSFLALTLASAFASGWLKRVNPCICTARLASALTFASHVWNRLSLFHPRAIHVWMRQNTLLYVFETINSTWRCTIASISSISRFASAHVRSAYVNTSGVYVTWARVCFAFVNISQKF